MAQVSLVRVNKVYPGNIQAVSNVNLSIERREFIVLVGPSGCGKTTILRMIAGLEEITQGKVYIGDKLVNEVPPKDRDIAMVFQNYALYPHMTVFQNMAFALKLRKYPKSEIESRVNDAAEILGIKPLLERKPKELSGGQRQRVAIARALVNNPSILLADEPTGNLDSKTGIEIMSLFDKLHQAGNTIILVTHEADIAAHAHRTVRLRDGQIEDDVRRAA